MNVDRYRSHLYKLVVEHSVEVLEAHGMPPELAVSAPELRRVILPTIADDTSYAIALHEIGHIVAKNGHGISKGMSGDLSDPMYVYDLLTEEFAAWAWARAQAIDWTVGMEQTEKLAIMSYLETLRRAKETAGLKEAA